MPAALKLLRIFIAAWWVAFALLFGALPAGAQIVDNGPMTLVITYKSAPQQRAVFRTHMETAGVRQFDQWKRAGVFRDYQVLASSYTGQQVGNFDVAVILEFASFTDTAKWKAIDRRMPGGLSSAGLKLGHANHVSLAYPIGRGEAKERHPAKAAYVLGLYEIAIDAAAYTKYAKGYVEPQLQGWMQEGAMSAYAMYLTEPGQKNANAPWTFLLVLEYTDMAALADSDVVKEKVRVRLVQDPAWKALSEDKGAKRTAKGFAFADAVLMPGR